jgi:NAD(P)-dependent dehydrogenase (short-subunit alcohol dehydrogenase family)
MTAVADAAWPGRLAGRRVLVTGAAGGMGTAVATRFARDGAALALTDRAEAQLEQVAADLRDQGADVVAVPADVRDEGAVAEVVAAAVDGLGGIDALYNNAGVLLVDRDGPTAELDADVWDDVFAINARGQFLFCKHALPPLLAADRGVIVNVSSVAGYAGNSAFHAYPASKAAVIGLTLSIAQRYGAEGLRAVALCPGFVDTQMVGTFAADAAVAEEVCSRTALARFGTPEEIAATAAYLVSSDASFVTSTVIGVHGGLVQ